MKKLATWVGVGILVALIVLLFSCEPYEESGTKYDSLAAEIMKRETKIATLEEIAWNWQNESDKLKAEKDSILSARTARRVIVATMPDHARDSLFVATTDTVSVPADKRLVTIEVQRITASNVLFSDLRESLEIIRLQESELSAKDNQIEAKDQAIIELKTTNDNRQEIIDGQQKDIANQSQRADKAERKLKLGKWLIPVAFIAGLIF